VNALRAQVALVKEVLLLDRGLALSAYLANMEWMNDEKRHLPPGVKTLGEAVRLLREDQGSTLRALAEKVGVSAPFLSDLEHGRRQTDRYEKLADALNVPVDEIRTLDARITPDLKDWLAENPKLVVLLKDIRSSGRPVPLEALRAVAKRGR